MAEASGWRVTVLTKAWTAEVSAAPLFRELTFKLPCGDGSLTVSELAESAKARATRLMPGVALEVMRVSEDGSGDALFPEDRVRDVLDNDGAVALRATSSSRGSGDPGGGTRRGPSRGSRRPLPEGASRARAGAFIRWDTF